MPTDPTENTGVSPGGVAQGAAVGAAGLSPFLGMLGEKKIVHDPYFNRGIKRTNSIKDIIRQAQPGDALVTTVGGAKRFAFKVPQSTFSGSDFYHVEPVVKKNRSFTAGQFDFPEYQNMTLKKLMSQTGKIPDQTHGDSVLLMRPNKPMNQRETQRFVNDALRRGKNRYDTGNMMKSYLKDIFVPKGLKTPNSEVRDLGGNMCSTHMGQSYQAATGKNISGYKPGRNVMPADLLRENSAFSPVIFYNNPKNAPLIKSPLRSKLLSRGILGAGLAGATYEGTEHPELAGGAAGALGGVHALKKLLQHRERGGGTSSAEAVAQVENKIPSVFSVANTISGEDKDYAKFLTKKYLTRSLPALAAGGVGGYYLTKALRNLLTSKRQTPTTQSTEQ